tara:strand:- start:17090 stop:17668 length:579 start_codon:yes stop_codon:yes gene_type:complete
MEQALTVDEVYYIHRLFSQLTSLLNGNIDYWLNGGTLLGAVRCGGMILCDDDIDIAIPLSQKNSFIDLCNSKFKWIGLQLKNPSNKYMKVIRPDWKNVWIDICFIDDEGYDLRGHKKNRRILPSEIYPLRYIQFSTFRQLLPIPCKSEEYLDRIFKNWKTEAVIYNHKDHKKNKQTIPLTDDINIPIEYHYK